MSKLPRCFYVISLLACLACGQSSTRISPAEAKDHIGKRATVCGKVASATYATRSRRQPTFLSLDAPYPQHVFTGVIWGEDRAKFGEPEISLRGKKVCVTDLIEEYRGKPETILRERGQLQSNE